MIKFLSLLLVPLTTFSFTFAEETRPNIILIMADDLNRDQVGVYGNESLTPHLDQLSAEGMRFDQAYAVTTVCSPSRYSVLTGRYPGRCTHPDSFKISPPGEINRPSNRSITLERDRPNLMKALQGNGYTTGIVGKWHLGEWMAGWEVNGQWKFPPGYNRLGLKVYPRDADFKDPQLNAALKHNQEVFKKELAEDGWNEAAAIVWANPRQFHHDKLYNHNMEWLTHAANSFVTKHQKTPFFLYMAITIPHRPKPIETLRRGDDPRITGDGFVEDHLGVQAPREDLPKRVAEAGYKETTTPITWMDDGVGALLKHLEALGLRDNTYVIFTSDHALPGKGSLYRDGLWIPLIINGPAIKPGINKDLVQLVDLAPTIMQLTNTHPQD